MSYTVSSYTSEGVRPWEGCGYGPRCAGRIDGVGLGWDCNGGLGQELEPSYGFAIIGAEEHEACPPLPEGNTYGNDICEEERMTRVRLAAAVPCGPLLPGG